MQITLLWHFNHWPSNLTHCNNFSVSLDTKTLFFFLVYNIEQVFKSVEYNLSFLKDWSNKDLSIGEEGGVYIYSLKVIMQLFKIFSTKPFLIVKSMELHIWMHYVHWSECTFILKYRNIYKILCFVLNYTSIVNADKYCNKYVMVSR